MNLHIPIEKYELDSFKAINIEYKYFLPMDRDTTTILPINAWPFASLNILKDKLYVSFISDIFVIVF
jgi:hypothetical protein